jgi:uncharacterized protein YdhG (YjbR/CyaY superfamily)
MPAATIDEFLAGLPADQRAALQRLREQIHAVVPEATETISYGIPGFRLEGRYFLGFGAGKAHCALYPGAAPIAALATELTAYRTRKGTIQFTPERPIPADLVAKLVRVRLAEHRGRG